jgi:alpha/beta superfamily hydrolase
MKLAINPTSFPPSETNFLIDGPAGHLELLTLAAKESAKGVAIICHPHPLQQGTMNNKVVHTLSRAFHQKQLHTVRFNYRGVGKSEGQFGESIGEIADLMAVLAWVDAVCDNPKIWLAGFSFGCFIAANGAINHSCEQLYSVAPAVTHQDFEQLSSIKTPWVVVQGEQDEVIPPQDVYQWYDKSVMKQPNMSLYKMADTTHFFHCKLIELRNLVEETVVGVK